MGLPALDVPRATLESCPPAYATLPTEGAKHRLEEYRRLAVLLGYSLMPWQELVLRVASEIDEDLNMPRYQSLVVTVPRQAGKSTLAVLLVLHRLLMHPNTPQRVVYAAQSLDAGKEFWKGDPEVRLLRSGLYEGYDMKMYRAISDTRMEVRANGSQLRILPGKAESAGHGLTAGMAVVDEAWVLQNSELEGALLPTMRTLRDPLFFVTSTAGTPESSYLRGKVELGRSHVTAGRQEGMAYFEWSSKGDPEDEDTWRQALPSLGWTVSMRTLRAEHETLLEHVARRTMLNQWVDAAVENAIPWSVWNECIEVRARVAGERVFAADAPPERRRAVITVADTAGNLEVAEWKNGTRWVVDWLCKAKAKRPATFTAVAVHKSGALGDLIPEMESKGLPVVAVSETTFAQACGRLAEAASSGGLRIRRSPLWKPAIAGSKRMMRLGAWRIARFDASTDVSVLCAAAMAYGHAVTKEFTDKPPPKPKFWSLSDFLD